MAHIDSRILTYGAAAGTGAAVAIAARWFPKIAADRRTRTFAAAVLTVGGAAGAAYTRRPWLAAVGLVGAGLFGEMVGEALTARMMAKAQPAAPAQAVAPAAPGPASALIQQQVVPGSPAPKTLPPAPGGRVQFQYPAYTSLYATGAQVEDLSDSFASVGL